MQHFIATYGYLAVFVLMAAESACIPVPSELIMLFGGALAAGAVAGSHTNLTLIIVAGTLGNVAGSYVAWAVGRYAGQATVRRWGRYVRLRDEDIDRAARWFERYGGAAVFFGRMLPVVRTFISLPAGFAAMRPVRFGVYTLAGCIPWTAALGIAGYAVGQNWQRIADAFHGPTYVIAGIIALAAVIAAVVFLRHRRREAVTTTSAERIRSARRATPNGRTLRALEMSARLDWAVTAAASTALMPPGVPVRQMPATYPHSGSATPSDDATPK